MVYSSPGGGSDLLKVFGSDCGASYYFIILTKTTMRLQISSDFVLLLPQHEPKLLKVFKEEKEEARSALSSRSFLKNPATSERPAASHNTAERAPLHADHLLKPDAEERKKKPTLASPDGDSS